MAKVQSDESAFTTPEKAVAGVLVRPAMAEVSVINDFSPPLHIVPAGPLAILNRLPGYGQRFAALVAKEADHGRAFLFMPVFLGLGAVLWFAAPDDPNPVLYRTGLFITAILVLLFRYRNPFLGCVAMAMALVFAGMELAAHETMRRATIVLDSPVTVHLAGRVISREAMAGGGWRYIVDVQSTSDPVLRRAPGRVALVSRGREPPLARGQGITGRARLSPPSGPALPGLSDFAFSSYFDVIGAIGFFYGAPRAMPVDAGAASDMLTLAADWIDDLRGTIGQRIRSVLPGDAGAFATAMVTDERRAMTRQTAEALRLSGLAHIIAISGLNMALSAGIFFVGLRMAMSLHQGLAQAVPIKKIAAVGALAGVTAYYLLSGSAVSAERAWLMMSIMLIAVLIGRPSISLRNVALSALVILVLSPSDVMGASFQMSFAATVALVAGYALFRERKDASPQNGANLPGLAFLKIVWRFFWGIALTSVIGGVSTAIFSIAHFQQLAVWGLPANLAAMPIVSFVVMPAGLFAMLLMPFGLDAWPLKVMGFGLDLVIAVAKEVASWSGEGGAGLLPPFALPLTVCGFLLLTLLRTRLRWLGAALIVVTLAAAYLLPSRSQPAVVIAESGDLVGLIGDEALATNRERPPSFIFGQWQRALQRNGHLRPVVLPVEKEEGSQPSPPAEKRRFLTGQEREKARTAITAALAVSGTSPGRFVCQPKTWCVATVIGKRPETDKDFLDAAAREGNRPSFTPASLTIAVLEDASFLGAACAQVDLIITPARLRDANCPPPAAGEVKGDITTRVLTGTILSRTGSLALRFGAESDPRRLVIDTAQGHSNRPWNRHRLYDWRSGTFLTPEESLPDWLVSDSDE